MIIGKRFTLEWWQTGIFKLALLFIGVAIGAEGHDLFAPHVIPLAVIGLLLGAYIWYVWARQ